MTCEEVFIRASREQTPIFEGDVCSYGCENFMNGAVISICTKYKNVVLNYNGRKPIRCKKCLEEFQ